MCSSAALVVIGLIVHMVRKQTSETITYSSAFMLLSGASLSVISAVCAFMDANS